MTFHTLDTDTQWGSGQGNFRYVLTRGHGVGPYVWSVYAVNDAQQFLLATMLTQGDAQQRAINHDAARGAR